MHSKLLKVASTLRKIAYGYNRQTYYKNDPFWMNSKYGGYCRACSEQIKKGDRMWYYPKDKVAYCEKCGKDAEAKFLAAVEDEEFYNRQYAKKERLPKSWKEYEEEVQKLEDEGMTTSDAQGVVDARLMAEGYDIVTLSRHWSKPKG